MKKALFIAIIGVLFLNGCYYDSQENLYPTQYSVCDSTDVGFEHTVLVIMENNCNSGGCHNTNSGAGGIILDTYEGVKASADNGTLLGSIMHEDGYTKMPLGKVALSSCKIAKISNWISEGAKNN